MVQIRITPDSAIEALNSLAYQRFRLEAELNNLKQELKDREDLLKTEFGPRIEAVEASIASVDKALLDGVQDNRNILIEKGKQSFTTLFAKFQLKKASSAVRVTDRDGVMEVARNLRVIRQIADPPSNRYKLNIQRFKDWIQRNPEYLDDFAKYLDFPTGETLTIQSNGTYPVSYEGKRISTPSISIKYEQGETDD